jgi:methyl-accepting chemotaxis protein
VADEVRKLAERSTSSAEEVAVIISGLNSRVTQVTGAMQAVVSRVDASHHAAEQTVGVIEEMVREISVAAEGSRGIGRAAEGQVGELGRMETTLEALFSTLHESGSKVNATATIGETIFRVSERLNDTMGGFEFERELVAVREPGNKRSHPRAENSLRVNVIHNGVRSEGVCLDLSLSGLRMNVNTDAAKGDELALEIYLPAGSLEEFRSQPPLGISGRVMWRKTEDGGPQYGVQFIGVGDQARRALTRSLEYFEKPAEYVA